MQLNCEENYESNENQCLIQLEWTLFSVSIVHRFLSMYAAVCYVNLKFLVKGKGKKRVSKMSRFM